MVNIKALRNGEGNLLFLGARGHSGYACEGQDIVCAAVSTLMQALAVGLLDVLSLKDVDQRIDPKEALMSYRWKEPITPELATLTETVFLSLKGIERAYPDYVKIFEGEMI